jgi:hypothetical protein
MVGSPEPPAPSPDGPRLLGAAARAADRERRIARLRARLDDLADDRELLTLELEEATGLLNAPDSAAGYPPADTEVVSAVLRARDAAQKVMEAADDVESSEEAERETRRKADAAAAELAGHCAEHDLPRTSTEVSTVLGAG